MNKQRTRRSAAAGEQEEPKKGAKHFLLLLAMKNRHENFVASRKMRATEMLTSFVVLSHHETQHITLLSLVITLKITHTLLRMLVGHEASLYKVQRTSDIDLSCPKLTAKWEELRSGKHQHNKWPKLKTNSNLA